MILLDTHVVIWLALTPQKLSQKAAAAIRESSRNGGLGVAAISLWEIAWLATRRRLQTSSPVATFVRETAAPLVVFPLTAEIAICAAQLPSSFPKDPQDRLIGATALVESIPLVTADENIRRNGTIRTIW